VVRSEPGSRAVTALLGATAAAAALFPLASFDLWWHLAAGRWIVAERAIPRTDPFSYTALGARWIDHEWLFQLLAYGVHELGGVAGLTLLRVAVVVAISLVALRFVRREAGIPTPAAALLLVPPLLLVARVRFLVRPELLTLLAAVLLTVAVLRTDRPRAGWRELWWLPPLFVPWANIHAGAISGLMILAAVLAGTLLNRILAPRGLAAESPPGTPSASTLGGLLAASTVACLVNPFGAHVLVVPFELTALMRDGPYVNSEWQPLDPGAHWVAVGLLLAAAVLVASRWRRLDWAALLPLAMVAVLAVRHARGLGLLGVLMPLLVARMLRPAGAGGAPRLAGIRPAAAAAVLAATAVALPVSGYQFRPGLGIDRRQIPVAATAFLEREDPPGNILNTYKFGGWLTWRLFPATRIFMDGRNEVFLDLAVRLDRAKRDSREWRRLLDDLDVGHALLGYADRPLRVRLVDPDGGPDRLVERPYTVVQFPRSRWALVYFDDTAMVMVRRTPDAASLIARHEYRQLYPESVAHQLETIVAGDADPRIVVAELERALAADPGNRRARQLLDAVLTRVVPVGRP